MIFDLNSYLVFNQISINDKDDERNIVYNLVLFCETGCSQRNCFWGKKNLKELQFRNGCYDCQCW